MKASPGPPPADSVGGYRSTGYRAYVLNLLLAVYVLNFIDRGLLSVVARPLKAEIAVSDTAWGLLTGFAFALLYTTAGIPLARIAETRDRVRIIAVCLAFWSLMTAACGLAADFVVAGIAFSGFAVLLACRVGVGLGEAGCTPPANSLIADYFAPSRRPAALGYYAMGVTIGALLANLIGGPVADAFGWRAAFMILGLPGVAVAWLLVRTVEEPPRGFTDPAHLPAAPPMPWRHAARELLLKRSYWWMIAGATVAAFCGYAVVSFQSLYLQRTFDLSAGQAALWFNVPSSAAGALGTWLLGHLAASGRYRDPAAVAWLAAGGLLLCVPFYVAAFTTPSMALCLACLALGNFVKYGYLTAQYTVAIGVASPRARATATAVLLFVLNLLGYGLGPLFAGYASDYRFERMRDGTASTEVSRPACDSAQESVHSAARAAGAAWSGARLEGALRAIPVPMNRAQYGFCVAANAESTRFSMVLTVSLYAFGALAFMVCARRLRGDWRS